MESARPEPEIIPEIEQQALGQILSDNKGAKFASAILQEYHFLIPIHRLIFEAAKTADANGGSSKLPIARKYIDEDAANQMLQGTNLTLKQYLAHIMANLVFGASEFETNCHTVKEQWARVTLHQQYSELAEVAGFATTDPKHIATLAGERTDEILSEIRNRNKRITRQSAKLAVTNAIQSADTARLSGNNLTGITWGLTSVNRYTGGIQKRDLTLIAARPSMGKSSIAVSCAMKAALKGAGVGIISLEMDAEKIGARMVSELAFGRNMRIPYVDIIQGNITQDQSHFLQEAASRLDDTALVIDDQSGITLHDIRIKTELMLEGFAKQGKSLDMMLIDHIGLIRPPCRYSGNRNNEIAEISAELKSMAREYDIAMVALSQLSRALEQRTDKRPVMSDLRDSGALEQDADTIIFLYREEYYLKREGNEAKQEQLEASLNKLKLIIAKQRNGPIEDVTLFCDMACSAVRDYQG